MARAEERDNNPADSATAASSDKPGWQHPSRGLVPQMQLDARNADEHDKQRAQRRDRAVAQQIARDDMGEADRDRSNRLAWKCPACRANLDKHYNRHTRSPDDCRWLLTEPRDYECPACRVHAGRGDARHTMVHPECKYGTAPARASQPRHGHHPRDPRVKATHDGSAELRLDQQQEEIVQADVDAAAPLPAPSQ